MRTKIWQIMFLAVILTFFISTASFSQEEDPFSGNSTGPDNNSIVNNDSSENSDGEESVSEVGIDENSSDEENYMVSGTDVEDIARKLEEYLREYIGKGFETVEQSFETEQNTSNSEDNQEIESYSVSKEENSSQENEYVSGIDSRKEEAPNSEEFKKWENSFDPGKEENPEITGDGTNNSENKNSNSLKTDELPIKEGNLEESSEEQSSGPRMRRGDNPKKDGYRLTASDRASPENAQLAREIEAQHGIRITEKGGTWQKESLEKIKRALDELPKDFTRHTTDISMRGVLTDEDGEYYAHAMRGTVDLGQKSLREGPDNPGGIAGTLAHEMTHNFQNKNPGITKEWQEQFWQARSGYNSEPVLKPGEPPVSRYGRTNPHEDMAEAVQLYYADGDTMKEKYPERYRFIKEKIMGGKEFLKNK